MKQDFTGKLESFENDSLGWHFHIKIPETVYEKLQTVCTDKRVICTLNHSHSYHCAMMPKSGMYYVLVNQKVRKKLQLTLFDSVEVTLEPDLSEYGMPVSEEWKEVFTQEPEAENYFKKLTAGKQRSLLHLVDKIKSSEKKIEKSIIIAQHLKNQKGNLDFKILQSDFKNHNF